MGHRCLVFAASDGSVRVFHPSEKKLRLGRTFEELVLLTVKHVPNLAASVQLVDLDSDDLPPRNKLCPTCSREFPVRDQWRVNPAGKLVVDEKPATVARNLPRAIHKAEDDLDAELAKPVPDAVAAIRAQRALEKLRRESRAG